METKQILITLIITIIVSTAASIISVTVYHNQVVNTKLEETTTSTEKKLVETQNNIETNVQSKIEKTESRINNIQKSVTEQINKKATHQEILNMLRADSSGSCQYMKIPTISSDYFYTAYINADLNKDGVTTGNEWARSMDKTCLFGFRTSNLGADRGYKTEPIGCAGGPWHEHLSSIEFPSSQNYLICSTP